VLRHGRKRTRLNNGGRRPALLVVVHDVEASHAGPSTPSSSPVMQNCVDSTIQRAHANAVICTSDMKGPQGTLIETQLTGPTRKSGCQPTVNDQTARGTP
jgi:hypothetical protein